MPSAHGRPQPGIRVANAHRILVHRVFSGFHDTCPRRMASPQPGIRFVDPRRFLVHRVLSGFRDTRPLRVASR